MTLYFSASTGGFYDDGIHAEMPGDAVEITADEHAALLVGQSEGKRIVADTNGKPVLTDPFPIDPWPPYQAQARAALDASDAVAVRCWKAGVAYPQAWRDYDTALRAIVRASTGDATQPLPTRPDYPAGT